MWIMFLGLAVFGVVSQDQSTIEIPATDQVIFEQYCPPQDVDCVDHEAEAAAESDPTVIKLDEFVKSKEKILEIIKEQKEADPATN